MGSLEFLSYFWSLNTIWVVKIGNFDFGGLSHTPNRHKEIEKHAWNVSLSYNANVNWVKGKEQNKKEKMKYVPLLADQIDQISSPFV